MTVKVEHQCADGTPFPVEFESEADSQLKWTLDPEHMPHRLTPMAEALIRSGDGGARLAYEEVDMIRPAFFRPGPVANGFLYTFSGNDDETMASLMSGCAALVERFGSALGVWRDYSLPLVRRDCERSSSNPDLPLAEHADLSGHALQATMLPAYICGADLNLLADVIKHHVEGDPRIAASELVQGQPSPTLDAARRLWSLGRAVLADERLSGALGSDDPKAAFAVLRDAGSHPSFFADLDAFLDEYGGRAEGWDIGFPTWGEMSGGFWSLFRTMSRPDTPDPQKATEQALARSDALAARIEAALADDAETLARFQRRLERFRPYVTIREERAHWQLVSVGCLRFAVLAKGQQLVDAGLVDSPDDALFLLPAEVEGASGDLRPLVAQRRAEHEEWLQRTPPEFVGQDDPGSRPAFGETAVPDQASPPEAAAGAEDGAGPTVLVRGTPGARGTATGRVRILRRLGDADGFDAGDVLVCRMTSPPWTPLFAVAAAVVAEGGDSGSHSAIAAREYGIPCVVGATGALSTLAEGQIVTVDGDAGTVTAA